MRHTGVVRGNSAGRQNTKLSQHVGLGPRQNKADFGLGPAGQLYTDDKVIGERGWRGTRCVAVGPSAVGRRKSACRHPPEQTAKVTPPFPTTSAGALEGSRYGRFAPQSPPHSPESAACYSVPIAAEAE